MSDPVENMFSIDMPKGWTNRVYSVRVYDVNTMVATSISPDNSVILFSGDPSMPQYWKPGNEIGQQIAQYNKMVKIEEFVPAEQFFKDYVDRKFGKLPGFKIASVASDEETRAKVQQMANDKGVNMMFTAAKVEFSFDEKGKSIHAQITGTTGDCGPFWIATVSGIATTGDPNDYKEMMDAIGKSHKMNPEWQAQQQQRHEQTMAEIARNTQLMTERHNANMQWIQDSAQRHQQRMQAIWSSNEAQNQAFQQRMNSMDNSQRNFLNYINDENTVVSSSGQSFQVDNSYQRYYMNKSDRTYVGGDSTMDIDQLRKLGLNPDDYEEVKVRQ